MAETKGIVIQFKGDTIELDKSLDKINNGLKALKKEGQSLNQQLKFDPKNADLLKSKLENLKSEQTLLTEKVKLYKEELAKLGSEDVGSKQWVALNKELTSAESDLRKVESLIQKIASQTSGIQNLANEFAKAEKTLKNVGDKLNTIGDKLMKFSGVAIGLGTAGLAYNAKIEQYTTALTTLTGSAEKANEIIKAINEDAKQSSFGVDALVQANQLLISAGVESDEAREAIMALGDAIAATGGGNDELNRMALNLQQVKNVGKASSVDIKQFAMAGINIYGLLAKSTGKTIEQVKKMDVTYEALVDALKKGASEGGDYFNAQANQAETLTGSITKLKDSFTQLLGEITQALVPIVKDVIKYVQDLINRVKNLDDKEKEQILRIGLVVAAAGPLVKVLAAIFSGLGSVTGGIKDMLTWFSNTITKSGTLSGVLGTLKGAFEAMGGPILAVIAVLTTLYTTNETFRNSVNNLVKYLIEKLKPALDLVRGVFDLFINIVNLAYNALSAMISGVDRYTGWASGIVKAIKTIIDTISLLIDWVSKAISWLNNLVGSANAAITASNNASSASTRVVRTNPVGTTTRYDTMASGGIGLTANIHVNNTGQPIDEAEVKRWANVMASQLDVALGRRM